MTTVTVLGRYRLVQRVGEGGMGVVHLALDPDGRPVAVKVLRPHVAADPQARQRLDREVATLRRVRHPRVAEVIDADTHGDQPYVVTRYVPAPPLDDLVRLSGPRTGTDLARLGDGLGQALTAIHDAGVVHRDLKPGNVLMPDGDPVVIDFGIAHVADDVRLTSTGLVMGTPGYLSPEVLDGDPVSHSTDWWGWAATMAFAATGRAPFGRGPLEAVLDRVRRGRVDLDGAPAVLVPVLVAALEPVPANRPDPAELHAAVQELWRRSVDPAPSGRGPADDDPTQVVATAHRDGGPDDLPTHLLADPVPAPRTVPLALPATRVMPPVPDTSPAAHRPAAHPAQPGPGHPGAAHPAAARPGPASCEPVRQPTRARAGDHPGAWPAPALAPPPAPAPVPGYGTAVPAAFWEPPRPVAPRHPGPYPVLAAGPGEVHPAAAPAGPLPPPVAGPLAPHPGSAPAPERVRDPLLRWAATVTLVVVAAVAPVAAVAALALWTVLARTVNRSYLRLVRRRAQQGAHRRRDVARAVLGSPWHLVVSVVTGALALVLPLVAGASAVFLTAFALDVADPRPEEPLPLAVGMLLATLVATWGPGGTALRRGSLLLTSAVRPGSRARVVLLVVLALVVVAGVLLVARPDHQVDWLRWQ